MEADKGARRCLLCLWSHSCRADPDPWHRTIGRKAGRSLAQFDGQVSCCRACCYYSLPWLDTRTMAWLSWDQQQTPSIATCPPCLIPSPRLTFPALHPTSGHPKSPGPLFFFLNSGQCLWIQSTLNMSHSTWYLSLWWRDFLTELKPYFSLNETTLLLFKLSIQTLATSPNRYATGIPGSTANSSYLVKGIRVLYPLVKNAEWLNFWPSQTGLTFKACVPRWCLQPLLSVSQLKIPSGQFDINNTCELFNPWPTVSNE